MESVCGPGASPYRRVQPLAEPALFRSYPITIAPPITRIAPIAIMSIYIYIYMPTSVTERQTRLQNPATELDAAAARLRRNAANAHLAALSPPSPADADADAYAYAYNPSFAMDLMTTLRNR